MQVPAHEKAQNNPFHGKNSAQAHTQFTVQSVDLLVQKKNVGIQNKYTHTQRLMQVQTFLAGRQKQSSIKSCKT